MTDYIAALSPRLWLKCNTGIYTSSDTSTPASANGDRIQLWADQSGNANNAFQTGLSTLRPTIDTSTTHLGRNAIRFTSAGITQMNINNSAFTGMTAGEIFVTIKKVADPPAGNADAGVWTMNDGSSFSTHLPYTDGIVYDNTFTTVRKTVGNPTPALTSWHVYSVRSAANDWAAYLDNSLLFSTATNTTAFPNGAHLCYLGKAWNDTYFLNGWIAELVIFPTTLSTQNRANVYDQLANGVSTPSAPAVRLGLSLAIRL